MASFERANNAYQVMPELPPETEAALRCSIQTYGVVVPIVVDNEGNIIDGHHRLRLALELEMPFALTVVVPVPSMINTVAEDSDADARREAAHAKARKVPPLFPLADDVTTTYVEVPEGTDPVDVAKTLNLDRRHLDSGQRQQVVAALREQGYSLRAIAGAVGASKSQVGNDIKQLSTSGQLKSPKRIEGRDGKSRSATRSSPVVRIPPQLPSESTIAALGAGTEVSILTEDPTWSKIPSEATHYCPACERFLIVEDAPDADGHLYCKESGCDGEVELEGLSELADEKVMDWVWQFGIGCCGEVPLGLIPYLSAARHDELLVDLCKTNTMIVEMIARLKMSAQRRLEHPYPNAK